MHVSCCTFVLLQRSPSPRPHPDPTQHPETDPKRTQNGPETDPNGPEKDRNGPEMDRNQALWVGMTGGVCRDGGGGGGCKGKRKSLVKTEQQPKDKNFQAGYSWDITDPLGERLRGNTIRGNGLRASERKSASERVSEREGFQRVLRGF